MANNFLNVNKNTDGRERYARHTTVVNPTPINQTKTQGHGLRINEALFRHDENKKAQIERTCDATADDALLNTSLCSDAM